ncbi:MAG TPA: type IV pilin protein [Pirellulales bacterium]|nr:type IV pilin protein [Pirellulales bacterium]
MKTFINKNPKSKFLKPSARRALTYLELIIVMSILGILMSLGIPSFQLAIEQSRAQVASANLEAIWSAQRLYWLENRTYSTNLATLQSAGMLDASLSNQTFFTYEIVSADANTFVATATRNSNVKWNGTFTIDQTGTLSGVLSAPPLPNIAAGFE